MNKQQIFSKVIAALGGRHTPQQTEDRHLPRSRARTVVLVLGIIGLCSLIGASSIRAQITEYWQANAVGRGNIGEQFYQ